MAAGNILQRPGNVHPQLRVFRELKTRVLLQFAGIYHAGDKDDQRLRAVLGRQGLDLPCIRRRLRIVRLRNDLRRDVGDAVPYRFIGLARGGSRFRLLVRNRVWGFYRRNSLFRGLGIGRNPGKQGEYHHQGQQKTQYAVGGFHGPFLLLFTRIESLCLYIFNINVSE